MARCTTCGRQDFTFTGLGTEVCRGCGTIVHDSALVRVPGLPHVPQDAPIHSLTPAPPVFAISDCHTLNTAIADYIRRASAPSVSLPDAISVGDIVHVVLSDRSIIKVRSGRPTDPVIPLSTVTGGSIGKVSQIAYEELGGAVYEFVTISDDLGNGSIGRRLYSPGRPTLNFPCCRPGCSTPHLLNTEVCASCINEVIPTELALIHTQARLDDIHNVLRRLVAPIGVRDVLRAKVEDEARLLTGRIDGYTSRIVDAAALADRRRQQELRHTQAIQERRRSEAEAIQEQELALLEKLMQKFNVKAKLPDNVRGVEPGERHLDM